MTAFYEEKGWWKSRTVWTGLLAMAYGLLAAFGVTAPFGFDMAMANELIIAIVGVLAIVFRVKATAPISAEVVPTLN